MDELFNIIVMSFWLGCIILTLMFLGILIF